MAYNLQTLITILEQILNPEQTFCTLGLSKPLFESLFHKATSLQTILAKPSLLKIQSLESQITKAVHEAEDAIESHVVDLIRSGKEMKLLMASCRMPDLQQVVREVDSAMEQALKLVEEEAAMASRSEDDGASSSNIVPSWKSVVVGVDEDLLLLKDRLTGTEKALEIIPIVGMGGIGKTTLARKLFEDPSIVFHFRYARAWATISQAYSMKAIIASLLRCIIGKVFDEQHATKEINELKVVLHQKLYGIRYMIVLDDVWSIEFLDEIRMYIPNNNNGSRIVITARESNIAKYADPEIVQHRVQLLSKPESWNLLHQIVFGEEEKCPYELQEIGQKIASDCGGLPLAINVIGGLLSKVERSKETWRNVGKDVRAAIAEADKQFSNILLLSYNHLPDHLKPCFLYMGAFPEDYEVKASRLVRLWVAEGFVKSSYNKSLEEEAEDYIQALVKRNLVLVRENKCNGKGKRFAVHDMLRDLCIRKAGDDNFLQVSNPTTVSNLRRVSIGTSQAMKNVIASAGLIPRARSIVCTVPLLYMIDEMDMSTDFYKIDLSPLFFSSTLLRVLDIYGKNVGDFPAEILQLVNLRYLAISCFSSIPSGISRLCYLQTLIVYLEKRGCQTGCLPWEILEMSELRHLEVNEAIWFEDEFRKKSVLNKLQSFSSMKLTPWVMKNRILESFPNIKKLGIFTDRSTYISVDLSHLHKLETLRCLEDSRYLDISGFPSSLRKLTMNREDIFSFSYLLCKLPNLEALTVSMRFSLERMMETLELAEGDELGSLQYLCLDCLYITRLRADETNFPVLRHLVIRWCSWLEEIPRSIGKIPTLELIEMDRCNNSVVASARKIQVEQYDYGNCNLQLRIIY